MIWKYFYSARSCSQQGTLYQLRNCTKRTNVVKTPIDGFDACEDFLVLVLHSHIVVAAMEQLGMSAVHDYPTKLSDAETIWTQRKDEREKLLNRVVSNILDTFTSISYNISTPVDEDKVFGYARQLLTIGSLYLELQDSIKEGDGLRVLRCYRYLLPIFHSSGRCNYAIECFNLLVQHDYLLSDRQASELIWSRFINTQGKPGKNIPNDLHCEHLNRLCKTAIKGIGANKTEKCITRVAKALGTLDPVLKQFDANNGVMERSGHHSITKSDKDISIVISELRNKSIFSKVPGRCHPDFIDPRDPLHAKSQSDMVKWILNSSQKRNRLYLHSLCVEKYKFTSTVLLHT